MPSSGRPARSVQPVIDRKPARQLNDYEAQTRVSGEEMGEWNMFFPRIMTLFEASSFFAALTPSASQRTKPSQVQLERFLSDLS